MRAKVLVTGAGGFIGHHLVTRLKEQGYWVRGVDIKHPEYAPTAAMNLKSWICGAGTTVCRPRAASTRSTAWRPTWAAWASSRPITPRSCTTTA